MSSKITIDITVQPDEKNQIAIKRETNENSVVSKSVPLPPDAEGINIEENDSSSEISPVPPQDSSVGREHEMDQYSSPPPPKFFDEEATLSDVEDDLVPAPPGDHPAISEAGETGDAGAGSSSPAPPSEDEGNNKTESSGKGKSGGKKKGKKK